jgi:hypothetical protein
MHYCLIKIITIKYCCLFNSTVSASYHAEVNDNMISE